MANCEIPEINKGLYELYRESETTERFLLIKIATSILNDS